MARTQEVSFLKIARKEIERSANIEVDTFTLFLTRLRSDHSEIS